MGDVVMRDDLSQVEMHNKRRFTYDVILRCLKVLARISAFRAVSGCRHNVGYKVNAGPNGVSKTTGT